MKGKDFMVKMGEVIYGYATDCSLNINTDTTEVSTTRYKRKTAGGSWKEFESDVNSWDGASNHVVSTNFDDYQAIVSKQLAGEPVDIEFLEVIDTDSGAKGATGSLQAKPSGFKYSGKAIITAIALTSPVDGDITFSVNFQGTGALTTERLNTFS